MSYSVPESQSYSIEYDKAKGKFRCRITSSNGYTIGIGWGNNPEGALSSAQIDRAYRAQQGRNT